MTEIPSSEARTLPQGLALRGKGGAAQRSQSVHDPSQMQPPPQGPTDSEMLEKAEQDRKTALKLRLRQMTTQIQSLRDGTAQFREDIASEQKTRAEKIRQEKEAGEEEIRKLMQMGQEREAAVAKARSEARKKRLREWKLEFERVRGNCPRLPATARAVVGDLMLAARERALEEMRKLLQAPRAGRGVLAEGGELDVARPRRLSDAATQSPDYPVGFTPEFLERAAWVADVLR